MMSIWAVVAAKEAALATGLGTGLVPAIGTGSLDGFVIGALMSGACFMMINGPFRVRRRGDRGAPAMALAQLVPAAPRTMPPGVIPLGTMPPKVLAAALPTSALPTVTLPTAALPTAASPTVTLLTAASPGVTPPRKSSLKSRGSRVLAAVGFGAGQGDEASEDDELASWAQDDELHDLADWIQDVKRAGDQDLTDWARHGERAADLEQAADHDLADQAADLEQPADRELADRAADLDQAADHELAERAADLDQAADHELADRAADLEQDSAPARREEPGPDAAGDDQQSGYRSRHRIGDGGQVRPRPDSRRNAPRHAAPPPSLASRLGAVFAIRALLAAARH
jgi:hypothetical protein